MRILFSQRTDYVPARGGATRTNRLLLEELARRGHECLVVAPMPGADEIANRPGRYDPETTCLSTELAGVTAHLVGERRRLVAQFADDIQAFDPAVIVVSAEDLAQALLRIAINAGKAPVVYFAQTVQALPCGPAAFFPSPAGTTLLRSAQAIVAISEYLCAYIVQWTGRTSMLLHPPVFGNVAPRHRDAAPDGFVTMVNPCGIKGISLFLQLADRLPRVRFAAVPGWGTGEGDLRQLRARPNITLLPAYDDVDEVLDKTSLLLVPSLWPESFGFIAIEGMLRGVPVIASAVGGLPEAMHGVDYCLPVNPIQSYSAEVDEKFLPIPIVPEQDVRPWALACEQLLSDRDRYRQLSRRCSQVAFDLVQRCSWDPMESLLLDVAAQRVRIDYRQTA